MRFFKRSFMKSSETREEAIIRLYIQGHRPYKITDMTGIRYQKVKSTIEYFQTNHQIPKSPERGRPKPANHIITTIALLTVQNRLSSCAAISQILFRDHNIYYSKSSVQRQRILLGFQYKPPKTRQLLTPDHINKRVQFAFSMLNS